VFWTLFSGSLLLVAGIVPNVLAFVLRDVDLSRYVFLPDFSRGREVDTVYMLSNTVVQLSIFGVVCYSLYHIYKLQKIREEKWREGIPPSEENEPMRKTDPSDGRKEYKCDEVYSRIVEYFASRQPFINPNFTIAQLATALNINTTYLSSAIRMKRNMNFNLFVNTYRVEKVKSMIYDTSNKYTIEYLYLSSGFRNQSTFNKAFKTCEGVTPTEYIKSKTLPTADQPKNQ
jgi:AraC-like DNA-binding protein